MHPEPLSFVIECQRSLFRLLAMAPIFLVVLWLSTGNDAFMVALQLWFFIIPILVLIEATQTVWRRRRDARWHWEYDDAGIRVYCRNVLQRTLQWEQVRKVRVEPSSTQMVSLHLTDKFFPTSLRGISAEESAQFQAFWMRFASER